MQRWILMVATLACAGGGSACKSGAEGEGKTGDTPPSALTRRTPAPLTARPATRTEVVSDTLHGVTVSESYRWLERSDDPAVKTWTRAQSQHARGILDRLAGIDAIEAQVRGLLAADTTSFADVRFASGRWFAMKRQPPRQHAFVVSFSELDKAADAEILVDPGALDPSGATTVDFYAPSPDGTLVAVSLSKGGSESGDVYIFDVASGAQVHEVIPGVNGGTAGGALAWKPDSSGFWYTRYPRGEERPVDERGFWVQVYWHALGTPTEEDVYELGRGLPRVAEYRLEVHPPSGRVLATVQDGDGGRFAHFLRQPDGGWKQFSSFGDKALAAYFGPDDAIYVLSRQDAPRGKVLRVSAEDPDISDDASLIIGEGDDTIVEDFWGPPTIVATQTRLFVLYQQGGPSTIRVFSHTGEALTPPRQAPLSAVGGLVALGGDEVVFWSESFVAPRRFYRFDGARLKTQPTALAGTAPARFDDIEVIRETATSKDGTRVPLSIIMRRGTSLDGDNVCLVTGYGGYGVNVTPRLRPLRRIGLDRGVVYVVANLRGGGEFGEAWHRGGNLTNKQNVFDDFAAVIRHLIQRKVTRADKVGIIGASNGGLLVGATLVQSPHLVRTAVSFAGIYDMLRVELSPNGAFNIPEFGTVEDPQHFAALHAYSPYHNVVDGVAYPSMLLLTGNNDPRVDPMQSRKMTARLQAAVATSSATERHVLLRSDADSGHGGDAGLDERVARWTDVYAFLFSELGVSP